MNQTGVRSTGSRRQARTRSGSTRPRLARRMQKAGEHPVPAGPLAVRWRAFELPRFRAGAYHACRVALENAGAARWSGLKLAYHWLDDRGNAIVWDGWRSELPDAEPGRELEVETTVQAPIPPGGYR